MKKLYTLLLICVSLLPFSIKAQTIEVWKNLNAFSKVNCMLDLDSTIWAGTNGGICSINKITLQVIYYTKINSGVAGDSIFCLEKDSSGNIWAGSNCGLIQNHQGNWTVYNGQNSILPINDISALYFNKGSNSLWVGLSNGQVVRKTDTIWAVIANASGFRPQSKVTSFVRGSNGYTWAGTTDNGAYHWDGAKWHWHDTTNSLVNNSVNSMAVDNKGYLWIANDSNLVRLYDTIWTSYNTPGCHKVNHLSIDSHDVIWMSTDKGLITFNGIGWTNKSQGYALADTSFTWHVLDGNTWWTATQTKGIEQLSGTGVLDFPLNPEVDKSNISDFAFGINPNKVWIAYHSDAPATVSSFDGNDWLHYSSVNSYFIASKISSLAVNQDSVLRIGTLGDGLYTKNGHVWSSYNTSNSHLTEDFVTALARDNNDNILIGFKSGGVQILNNGNILDVLPNTVANCKINDIYPDAAGNTWLSTESAGIIRLSQMGFSFFNTTNSGIPSNHVLDIMQDAFGIYQIATDSGLVKFDGSSVWMLVNTSNSAIASNDLTCVCMTSDSSIWVGTRNSGFSRYKNNNWITYDKCNSPLVSNSIQSLKISPDDKLYIGTTNGATVFNIDIISGLSSLPVTTYNIVYPNPASSEIHFNLEIQGASRGIFNIYNNQGQQVFSQHTIFSKEGKFNFSWDIKNSQSVIQPGLYFYQLQSSQKTLSGKFMIVK